MQSWSIYRRCGVTISILYNVILQCWLHGSVNEYIMYSRVVNTMHADTTTALSMWAVWCSWIPQHCFWVWWARLVWSKSIMPGWWCICLQQVFLLWFSHSLFCVSPVHRFHKVNTFFVHASESSPCLRSLSMSTFFDIRSSDSSWMGHDGRPPLPLKFSMSEECLVWHTNRLTQHNRYKYQ